MNLSAYDHDHMYLGTTMQGRNPPPQNTQNSLNSRNMVSQENTSTFNNSVTYQQASQRLQYQHVQMYQQSNQVIAASHSYSSTQSFTTSQGLGNSLNLSGLLREATPEPAPKVEPVIKVEEPQIKEEEADEDEFASDIDIQIRNVVCNYTLPLHIDLRRYALSSSNITYDRGRGVLLKQKRNPNCYVKIYSSGKVYIVGCKSEMDCLKAARNVARSVQRAMGRLNDVVKIRNYRVCNVLATCKMPFGIKIEELAQKYPVQSQYEPELSVGLVWRSQEPKGTLRIHTTGSITVTGACSEEDVCRLIEIIYGIVRPFRCSERHRAEKKTRKRKAKNAVGPTSKKPASGAIGNKMYFSDEDDFYDQEDLDDLDD